MQHGVLRNILKIILNTKDRTASLGATAASTGNPAATGPRTSSGTAGRGSPSPSEGLRTDPDAGSGAEGG